MRLAGHRHHIYQAYQAGVSLIELMISITIGMVVLGAILAVYSATSSTGRQSEAATRMSEDAAVAMNYMAGYIRMAGYSKPLVNLTQNCVQIGGATKCNVDSNFAGASVFGCDKGFSNPTVAANANSTIALACNSAASTATSAISIRFEGDVYNTGASGSSPTDCLGQGVTANTAAEYVADTGVVTYYPLVESRFYVKAGSSSGVNELMCGGSGTGTNFVAQPVMQYVESLNFVYGIATDSSSQSANRYLTQTQLDADATTLGITTEDSWKRVVSVKICMVMRSEAPDQNGSGSYVDCSGTVVASGDKYLRRAFRSVVSLRNRGAIS